MATEIYRHPDMLKRGAIYKVYFRGHTKTKTKKHEGKVVEELVATGVFYKMMVAFNDNDTQSLILNETHKGHKKVLVVLFRSPKEDYARVISWYRITQIEEVSEEEAYL